MRILVDADACPNAIKEILFRAATSRGIETVLVANQPLRTPSSPQIRTVQVRIGMDTADHHIVEMTCPGDLVITADIPLAAAVVDKGGLALNPNGELYTSDNVRQCLTMRNLMQELRSAGMVTGGPPSPGKRERGLFAAHLDRIITRAANQDKA
ncbi:MAG: YaiI/YqxD family protein [Desulfovibrionales bacterium]